MFRLSRLEWDWGWWWKTRRCQHPAEDRSSMIIDSGRRKLYWCRRCQRNL